MKEIFLIAVVNSSNKVVHYPTGGGSSTAEHLYVYSNIGSAKRQLTSMTKNREVNEDRRLVIVKVNSIKVVEN